MSSPRRLLAASLLSATLEGTANQPEFKESVKVTGEAFHAFMEEAQEQGLLTLTGDLIECSLQQRLDLAGYAIRLGVDPEAVSRSLTWLEFEEFSARVLEENGFRVKRRFRFTAEGRRWEIDLLASRKPWIILAECKHWTRGMGNSVTRGIIEGHLEKSRVLAEHVSEIAVKAGINGFGAATLIPVALTLSATPLDIYRRVPSVSILSLPSFLSDYDGYLERLANIRVEVPQVEAKKKKTRKKRLPAVD